MITSSPTENCWPGPIRFVTMWRPMGISKSWAAAHRGSYSALSYPLPSGGYTVIMAPASPIFAERSSSLTASPTSSTLSMAIPLSCLGIALQNSASQSLYILKTPSRSSPSSTLYNKSPQVGLVQVTIFRISRNYCERSQYVDNPHISHVMLRAAAEWKTAGTILLYLHVASQIIRLSHKGRRP